MNKMKALVKAKAAKGLWMQEVPVPEPGYNDVIIKVKKSAICGTDLHIYEWNEWAQKTIKVPMTIGHEYMGYVDKAGPGVTNVRVGDRVTGEGHLFCGVCRNCRRGREHVCENVVGIGVNIDGSFAEYVRVPARNVVLLDHRIPDEWAAIMDPFGNATHTALAFPLLGEDVLITGSGLIGSMAVAIARFAGARNVVASDLSDYRLELAKKMGATMVINPKKGQKRLRCGTGDVGLTRRLPGDDSEHVQRFKYCLAGYPSFKLRGSVERYNIQGIDSERYIWTGDVGDMVQDADDDHRRHQP
jgi:threonine 3-dehydrogenase